MPLPCAAAMPRRNGSTSSGSSGSEDGSSGRRQRDHLEALLAEQPMSWMSSPGARPRPEPFSYLLLQIITLRSGCAPVLLTM